MNLLSLGWGPFFEGQFPDTTLQPCRIVSQGQDLYVVHDGGSECVAFLRGRARSQAGAMPVVGDWVLAERTGDRYAIETPLKRRTAIERKQAGARTAAQVLAANIDRVLLVTSMNADFSARRLERYITLALEGGATPVIVLTKADLVPVNANDGAVDDDGDGDGNGDGVEDGVDGFRRQAEAVALGFPVVVVSNVTGAGIAELRGVLVPGETIVLLGSSGVGKSTLINVLGGSEIRKSLPIREKDGKGRHVTTARQLVRLPSGLLLIDTPGLREVQLWARQDAADKTFTEISAMAEECRFRDCQHDGEPGCAVAAATEAGEIGAERVESYRNFRRELAHLERQTDKLAELQEKRKVKGITRAHEKKQRKREKP